MKKRVEQIIEQNQRQNSQIAGALAGALSQALTPPPLPPMPVRKSKGRRQAAQDDGNLPLRLTPYGDGLAENGFSDPISGKIWVTNNYS